jgi:NRPS condensation-like uncharacterized protein
MTSFSAPLPLVAFEEYMFRDDRPSYPMGIVARLRFQGQLDRQAASAALEQVVSRHPLLRARIQEARPGRFAWVPAENHFPAIEWTEGPAVDRLPAMRHIDLSLEPGLRVWATSHAEASSLSLQVHHAACDGKAVLQVLDELVHCYASNVEGKPLDLPPCDEESLHGRGTFGLTFGKMLRMLPAQLSGLFGVREFLMRQPVPLLRAGSERTADPGPLPTTYPDVKFGRLSADEVRKLSSVAADARVTLNDWLLRDFFAAINDFRGRYQQVAADEWLRISVPISLRHTDDRRISAANAVSMVFLDRTPAQIADSAKLLRTVHEEMDLLIRRQLGLTFIWSLWVLRLLPGGMARRFDSRRCEVTCVVSNLGRAMADSPLPRRDEKLVAGNVVLDQIDFFSPVRDGTSVTVGLVFYAGSLQVCMQYDSRRITAAQAEDLMATYLRKLRESPNQAIQHTPGNAA